MGAFEISLALGSALLVLSVIMSKAASRLGIPALLLFLAIGMAAGSHGLGHIAPPSEELARGLGVFALAFILFSGGLDTELEGVRPIVGPALAISTFGVVIASAMVGVFAHLFLGFSWLEGFLLGATIASTDVAAVFTVLRSKGVNIKGELSRLLELESALNDPMAVFLGATLLTMLGDPAQSPLLLIPIFFRQMVLGTLIGWGSGRLAVLLINRIKLEFEGLYPVLSVGWILLTYAITQSAGGSGFLAVYLAGIVLGNANLLHRRSLVHFHEGAAWLGQIAMFLTMGLLVRPSELWEVAPAGIALSAFLILVARPASVFLSIPESRFSARDKLMVSWAGLRGAVPIILASYVLASGFPKARVIFDLVFFITFFSVLLQGSLIPVVARKLKVNAPFRRKFRFPIEFNPVSDVRNRLIEIPVPASAPIVGKALVELSLPRDILVVLIQRKDAILVPRGATHVEENDTLLVLSESKSADEIRKILF